MEAEEFPTSGPSLGTIFSAQGVTRGKMISFLASSERFSGSCDLGFWDMKRKKIGDFFKPMPTEEAVCAVDEPLNVQSRSTDGKAGVSSYMGRLIHGDPRSDNAGESSSRLSSLQMPSVHPSQRTSKSAHVPFRPS